MKRLFAIVALAALCATPAQAAPVAYRCEVSGAGGALAFGFSVDADARQATASWSGEQPWRAGESFSEDADLLSITGDNVAATFRKQGYAYYVRVDRASGAASLSFPRDGAVVESTGTCGASEG